MSTPKALKINLPRLRAALRGDITPTGTTLGLLTGEIRPITNPKTRNHGKGKRE